MLSATQLDKTWARALRAHALEPMIGDEGKPYLPIGKHSLELLDALWKPSARRMPDVGAMIEAGKTVMFWSDPHFGHGTMVRRRPDGGFSNVDEMDAILWSNLWEAARSADLVVCLGDFAMRNPISIHRRCAAELGGKHLAIVGNHDVKGVRPQVWAASGALASLAFSLPASLVRSWVEENHGEIAELVDWRRLPPRLSFGLSHWPVPPSRMPGPGWVNLHGHIHSRPTGPLRVNCSVEALGYRPRPLQDLMTPELMDDLVRRQSGPHGLDGVSAPVPGDSGYAARGP
jgi:calcineurin-like phosphoesterase family protein